MPNLRQRRVVRLVLPLAFAVLALGAASASAAPSGRVINGANADLSDPRTGAVVAIGNAGAKSAWDAFQCGGTLIAPQVVVTARHCVDFEPFVADARKLVVMRGTGPSLDLPKAGFSGVFQTKVVSIHRSPGRNFQAFNRGGDIAVLRLEGALPNATPVAYARPENVAWFAPRAAGVTLLGYGATVDANERTGAEAGGYPTKLQTAELPIVSDAQCRAGARDPKVTANYLCAGVVGAPAVARSSCYGDSGGPLLAADPALDPANPATARLLVGIVSFGEDDRCGGSFTRYVRVDRWASWLDGFVASSENAPSQTAAPVVASAKRSGPRGLSITPAAVTAGPAPTRLDVLVNNGQSTLLELGTIPGAGGTIAALPTRSGKLNLLLRAFDAAGNESASSAPVVVQTVRDRAKPRIAKASAKSLGRGRWTLSWTRPVDNDRVVGVLVERKRPGAKRWSYEANVTCGQCWTKLNARVATRSAHFALPGSWQFRFTPVDRAGNRGVPVVAA